MGMKQNSLTLPFPNVRLTSVTLIDNVWVVWAIEKTAGDVQLSYELVSKNIGHGRGQTMNINNENSDTRSCSRWSTVRCL
jgi:hypothetical protein